MSKFNEILESSGLLQEAKGKVYLLENDEVEIIGVFSSVDEAGKWLQRSIIDTYAVMDSDEFQIHQKNYKKSDQKLAKYGEKSCFVREAKIDDKVDESGGNIGTVVETFILIKNIKK